MTKSIAKQLLSDARNGIIDKDALLSVCLSKLESISEEDLYRIALDEGFIQVQQDVVREDTLEPEIRKLSASQRIIEKVLSRYGE